MIASHRYQAAMSDIAGQDIKDHRDDPLLALKRVRDWLLVNTQDPEEIPGVAFIRARYRDFRADLPAMKRQFDLDDDALEFRDLSKIIGLWLRQVA